MADELRNIPRRKVLQLTSAAGATSFGVTSATATNETEEKLTDITFVEIGISFNYSDSISENEQNDPLEYYRIRENELIFLAITKENIKKFVENEGIVRYNQFHSMPARLSRQRHSSIGSALNERLRRTGGVVLSEPVSTPPIQIENSGGNLIVSVKQNEVQVDRHTIESINLDTVETLTDNKQMVEAQPKVTVMNHGELDVYAENILEDE